MIRPDYVSLTKNKMSLFCFYHLLWNFSDYSFWFMGIMSIFAHENINNGLCRNDDLINHIQILALFLLILNYHIFDRTNY